DIGNDQVRPLAANQGQRHLAIGRLQQPMAGVAQQRDQVIPVGGPIIDDQNGSDDSPLRQGGHLNAVVFQAGGHFFEQDQRLDGNRQNLGRAQRHDGRLFFVRERPGRVDDDRDAGKGGVPLDQA